MPQTVDRKVIDVKHPEFQLNQEKWFQIQLLVSGGDAIKRMADRFLKKRPKEDNTVYQHRVDHFCYENNLGTAVGWYLAQMFEDDPTIDVCTRGEDGNPTTKVELPKDQMQFYRQQFLKDCDRHGTTLVDAYREVFSNLLKYQRCFISIDLPPKPTNEAEKPASLEAQRAQKLLDPYICVISPQNVINWDCDDSGNLNWLVIYHKKVEQRFLANPWVVERWYYYDRAAYKVYESRYEVEPSTIALTGSPFNSPVPAHSDLDAEKHPVVLVDEGPHPLSGENMVPFQLLELPDEHYMGDRAYLPALEHLNVSNALKWSLFMAALAVPVITGDNVNVSSLVQSETGFFVLPGDSKYGFAEPSGTCWEALADRARVLTEEIWRAFYLVAQARTTSATSMAQSGVSKKQDMSPSHDVMNSLGDVLRAGMQRTLELIAKARVFAGYKEDEKVAFDVRGFAFENKLSADELAVLQEGLGLDIPSDTLEKELHTSIARNLLPDANADTLGKIADEIRKAPPKMERDRQKLEMQNAVLTQAMVTHNAQATKETTKQVEQDDPEGVGTDPEE